MKGKVSKFIIMKFPNNMSQEKIIEVFKSEKEWTLIKLSNNNRI